jgi:ribosomal protein S18 acetylase RimI-like enzyme
MDARAGRVLVAKLISKLNPERRSRLNAIVRETNQDALKFFRGMGFKACKVLRNLYRDTDEDAYVMEYSVEQPSKKVVGKSSDGKADDCFGV